MCLITDTRVTVVSYNMTASSNLKKVEIIGRACRLTLIRPKHWPWYVDEPINELPGVTVIELPVILAGRHHFYLYSGIESTIRKLRPDLLYFEQEPWSLSTFQIVRAARAVGCRMVGMTWQNIWKWYPPPFNWIESYVHRATHAMIAGNEEAAALLRRRGFRGPISVVPPGVDIDIFHPRPSTRDRFGLPVGAVVFGFLGRLVPEKGVQTVLEAAAQVPEAHIAIAGTGPFQPELEALSHRLGLRGRLSFLGGFSSFDVADVLASFDVLVLPSLTTAKWKEQFGRVLIEAMACGVPVIGSSSAEIPNVIGDAGLVFKEGDAAACAGALSALLDPTRRAELRRRGQERVMELFTHERIATRTLEAWELAWQAA